MAYNPNQSFEFTHIFDAPREQVFKTWTELGHFAKWWGPKGAMLEVVRMDARSGGEFLGFQTSPDGKLVMWRKFAYLEVVEPEKVAYIQSFSDERGNTVRAPFRSSWPLEIMNSITFKDDEGKTVLKLTGYPVNASAEEQESYNAMAPMLQQDLEGAFDKLADYLVSLPLFLKKGKRQPWTFFQSGAAAFSDGARG
ncbi:SRPBCC domain-containing protein [Paenibacillus rhizovicinus]|uniref:SRPBCC domain-containing protein n=1 Tax=Paenibacillus rhizovicinus TaxID=2704463 RepID=A0A6C0P2I6_9BACL|nr:SRPBCC domain-containing protein [Paenibacillus rhizovicinus]QHW32724.1 SRPBCC domain-containing protein [Paenibacillus rhizovicinus]